jgi:solute:Na+ symporter, SSS family
MAVSLGHLSATDIAIVCAYILATIALGMLAHRSKIGSSQYLNASQSLPVWLVSVSFIAANCGALELLGISATAAQYGAIAFHFYWIGAVPALICLAVFVLPVYAKTRIRSVPDYLRQRFDERARTANVIGLLCITVLLSGISLYAMEVVLAISCGWPTWLSGSVALLTVAVYTTIGGLRATIYNEVLQLSIILCGLFPLSRMLLQKTHGLQNLKALLPPDKAHAWIGIPVFSSGAAIDMSSLILGLGLVLSFGYWCTDFVQIQRILATKDLEAARRVPLIASLGKMGIALLIVIPGLAALTSQGSLNVPYNAVLPALMVASYSRGWLGLGIAGILASLISNLSGNASAFSAIWTEEIYRPHLQPGRSASHYIAVGRMACLAAVGLSAAASVVAFYFQNLMEYIQLIFSVFSAPVFGIMVCGMIFPWVLRRSGLWGLIAGFGVSIAHLVLIKGGFLNYGSNLNATFHGALYAWAASVTVVLIISKTGREEPSNPGQSDSQGRAVRFSIPLQIALLATVVAIICIGFNVLWR